MATEGVIGNTVGEFKAHPWLIGGAFVALVLLIWFLKSGKTSTPQSFNFSYGPSDAQVLAGTQLSIAQQADQTQLAIANLQATNGATTTNDYFNYLTQANNNATAIQSQTVGGNYNLSSQKIQAQNYLVMTAGQVANEGLNLGGQLANIGTPVSYTASLTNPSAVVA